MLPFEDRYSRQRRLAEVGPEGQRLLEQASLCLPPHAGVELEREYLARAGVGRVEVEAAAAGPEFPWAAQFQFDAARAVAQGAWCALARLRALLGVRRAGGAG